MTVAVAADRTTLLRNRLLGGLRPPTRVCLLVAPAGWGKTTLLAQLAELAEVPVLRTTAREWDGSRPLPGRPACLAIDDAHELDASRAHDLADLLDHGPPDLTLLVAGRVAPPANVSRLRAAGELAEVGPEDLRFRSWEIDDLFRDVYGERLAPGEVTDLGRRSGGWAACLHLFHVATAGKAARMRRGILTTLPRGLRTIQDYLTQNVVDDLPRPLRCFLVETSVLPILTVEACDGLRGAPGSRVMLEDLEDRRLLRPSLTTESWRCHEMLRDHLQTLLLRDHPDPAGVRRRAADVLERAGAVGDAFRVLARAEEWGAARSLVARHGGKLADSVASSGDPVPRELASDPWIATAEARRLRAEGRFDAAAGAYRRAEGLFGSAPSAETARAERISLTAWTEPLQQPSADWSGTLRAALGAAPADAPPGSSVHEELVRGLLTLVAGEVTEALPSLRRVADDDRSSAATSVAASVAVAAALSLAGEDEALAAAELAADEAELAGLPGLVEVARSTCTHVRGDPSNPVAAAVEALFRGIQALRRDADALPAFDEATAIAHALELRPLEAWGRAGRALALARAGDPVARSEAAHSESIARVTRVRGPQAYALLACAEADDDPRLAAAAVRLANECGLGLPLREAERRMRIRCFGGLRVEVAGEDLSLEGLRPRSKQLLRFLLLHVPRPVHREVLVDALWPNLPPRRAASSLHVALSSLRHALGDRAEAVIRRDGDAYTVDTGAAHVDLVEFRAATDRGAELAALQAALDLYRGDVFPEEGPAEWIVEERELLRERAVRAAETVAERVVGDDPRAAAAACERGLELDRHADGLWRLLIAAYERAGNPAAARRAASRYEGVLADLGVALGAR
ncbi:MAG TPA: BTAD domain-containing putative transcriptional regulator [Actinomycetota bacterium]|nr:BTAD domain-containing putative transcriptional regulator [Actinomycetota bacterium]